MVGGRERNEAQFRDLLAGAGFRLTRIVPTASPACVIEAVAESSIRRRGLATPGLARAGCG
jgi:hypothetical protein